jgi:uridine kinase
LIEQLDALRRERTIEVPVYDFSTHLRVKETRRVEPAPIVIVEGILVLADEALRERLDLKIYVDTAADLRILRRIRRDMESRGRSLDEVREQYYETVRPMLEQFVEPSKRWADVIIPEGGHNQVALDLVIGRLEKLLDRGAR